MRHFLSQLHRSLDRLERHLTSKSLAHTVVGVIVLMMVFAAGLSIWNGMASEYRMVEAGARREATASLDMLGAVHTNAMINRKQTKDGDPAIDTLNGTMEQFSKTSQDVSLRMVMGQKIEDYQRAHNQVELELPLDDVDREALRTGETQTVMAGNNLRMVRPIIFGQGEATVQNCGGCHASLMGITPGEVMGAYSSTVSLAAQHAATKHQLWSNIAMAVVVIAVVVFILLLLLHVTVLRPIGRLNSSTVNLASGNPDTEVACTDRPDEIGAMARALEASFRENVVARQRLIVENDYNAFLAQHDSMTNLPNRLKFDAELRDAISFAKETKAKVAGIIIDIDRFKFINDRFGHAMGDAVLKSISAQLATMLKDGECVGRYGGDEFAAFKIYKKQADLEDFIARLCVAFGETVVADKMQVRPAFSVGISLCPEHTVRGEQLVLNADLAMYRAKRDHSVTICYFDDEMDADVRMRGQLVDELEMALENDQFTVHYQIQNCANLGDPIGCEALIRWNHPVRGMIGPFDFIPLAEEAGLISQIGEWVLREACRVATNMEPHIIMAVNVSAIQFNDVDFPRLVLDVLTETGLSPSRLELEVTETALMANRTRAIHVMRQIKALGVKIAIDDFGVGYSSLDTLDLFPIDKIKIDKTFIHDFESHPHSQSLIKAVLSIGESLGVHVMAEGVETPAQLAMLRGLGCNQVQGYYFSRPVPAEQLPSPPAKVAISLPQATRRRTKPKTRRAAA